MLQIGAVTVSPEKAVPLTVIGLIADTQAVATRLEVAALRLPSFLRVRFATPDWVGLRVVLKSAVQALVLAAVMVALGGAPPALVDMHSVPALTLLPRSRVPEVIVASLLVEALKVAKVPPDTPNVRAPRISIPTRIGLTLRVLDSWGFSVVLTFFPIPPLACCDAF